MPEEKLKSRVLLLDCGKSWFLPEMQKVIRKHTDSLTTININEVSQRDPNDFDCIIFSGSPLFVSEAKQEDYFPHISWCIDTGLPILGVCFGHQLIGWFFGSKIIRGPVRKGNMTIKIVKDSSLFDKLEKEFVSYINHEEEITLPEGFTTLASSDRTEVEAMKHNEKKIYGVQFHPEKTEHLGEQIYLNFLKKTV
jgi:GMP synthase (glutamine-hydrolysing)